MAEPNRITALYPGLTSIFPEDVIIPLKTVHVQVFGRVQGVFFRDYTRRKATALGIHGWVRNSHDGSVETLLSGPHDAVDAMVEWLYDGSPAANVQRVVVESHTKVPESIGFDIVY